MSRLLLQQLESMMESMMQRISFAAYRPVPPHLIPPPAPSTPGAPLRSQLLPLNVTPGSSRDGMLFIPSTYTDKQSSPLLLMLHGACASGQDCADVFRWEDLEAHRVIMLLPDSRGRTWDIIRGSFGADVRHIDKALRNVFQNFNINPQKVCCGGFSDGASYALSLGLPNGGSGIWKDQQHGPFTHIMALSPGFMRPSSVSPIKPKVYISHGIGDQCLDINHCSRRIVGRLGSMGFKEGQLLEYHEFTGGHCIPAKIAAQALQSFAAEDSVKA